MITIHFGMITTY